VAQEALLRHTLAYLTLLEVQEIPDLLIKPALLKLQITNKL
jgi:hypothetical protein